MLGIIAGELPGTPLVVIKERGAEKAVFAFIEPKSGVEYTPDGIDGVVVLNVFVETQNE